MGNFPFFGFPYSRYYYNNYCSTYPHSYEQNNTNSTSFKADDLNVESFKKVDNTDNSTCNKISKDRKISSNIDEPIFEILGISLYLDDIIILCLLFFLYTEGVQDELLFIVLILLLLS